MTKVTIASGDPQTPFVPRTKRTTKLSEGVPNMLTITDLKNEQELSSFEMGKIAGGNVINNICHNALSASSDSGSGSGSGSSSSTGHRPLGNNWFWHGRA